MQIPSIAPATVASALELSKSQQLSPTPEAAKPNVPSAQELASAMHSLTAPASQKSQLAPGMSIDQLSSMLQTSLKMQAINNDPSIPPEVKQKLLAPLLQANRDSLAVADARAEQEEKGKIIEAASEDAQAIREAGEEIAEAAAEARDELPEASAGSGATTDPYSVADTTVAPPAAEPEAVSPAYSDSADAPVMGKSIDTLA